MDCISNNLRFSLRTLFDTRHPAVKNMCKRLVFHYVSPFQHYHHHPITLDTTTYRSKRQKAPGVSKLSATDVCKKLLFFLIFVLSSFLFDDIEKIMLGHSAFELQLDFNVALQQFLLRIYSLQDSLVKHSLGY